MTEKCPVCGAGLAGTRVTSAGKVVRIFKCGRDDDGSTHELPGCLRRLFYAMTDRAVKAEAERDQCKVNLGGANTAMRFMDQEAESLSADRDRLAAELEQARAACAAMREGLDCLLDLVRHETDLPESAANGNKDSSGTIDEGVVMAGRVMEQARKLLTKPNPGQPLLDRLRELEDCVRSIAQALGVKWMFGSTDPVPCGKQLVDLGTFGLRNRVRELEADNDRLRACHEAEMGVCQKTCEVVARLREAATSARDILIANDFQATARAATLLAVAVEGNP